MRSGDVIRIGLDAETSLQRTLDGFLAGLDRKTAATVFDLFGRLEKGVDDAKLPEVLEQIQRAEKPGLLSSILGRLRGKSRDDLAQELFTEIGDLVAGRTRNLADEMTGLEKQLEGQMQKLFAELDSLDALKQSYTTHFADFTVAAGVARAFVDRARAYVVAERAKADPADVTALARIQELQDKLQLLESRAVALESTYTRLPADRLVIQQIEQAGIATLQETATTVASRFASIKMTLLSINGAFAVKSVQQVADRQAQLDRQLADIRGRVLKEVAVSAAEAPGENRLAQAQQIEQIIATTKEIHALVETAKQTTDQKFELARQKLAAARQELATLSRTQPAP
jgi:DNA repair exonuclease SbcCD ATPase subunit